MNLARPSESILRALWGLALLALVAAGVAWAVEGQVGAPSVIALILAVLLGGIAIYLAPDQVRAWISGRPFAFGANAVLASVAFIGIMVLLNILATRHAQRWDLTAEKRFSLSPQTLQILRSLPEPVEALAFFSQNFQFARQDAEDLLDQYRHYSNGKFSYRFIDPVAQASLARQWGVTRDGTILFVMQDRRQEVTLYNEQEFTSALVKLIRTTQPKIYFLTGHGERDINEEGDNGYAQVRRALEREGYRVEALNLAVTSTIPADAAVILLAGPVRPLLDREVEVLKGYLNAGGRLLIALDSSLQIPGDAGGKVTESVNRILGDWGIAFRDDVIIDPVSSMFTDPLTPLSSRYGFSSITEKLRGIATAFPAARSIEEVRSQPERFRVVQLVETTPQSWSETDLEGLRQALNQGRLPSSEGKKLGPLALALTVEQVNGKGRVVLFGDADFAANQNVGANLPFANLDLFVNAVNWLSESEMLIGLRQSPTSPVRALSATPAQTRTVFMLTVVAMPLAVLAIGAMIWWQRR
ncbi:GldG family protein [Thermoflexus sp.]|uniref:GldG family protein n=1 Tax=Thermoflexus sp. TaxID=1969742 RepID=UPI002ADE3A5C|nr:GldG family protein [Thermoflexus sp.]